MTQQRAELVERLREVLAGREAVREVAMFGGRAEHGAGVGVGDRRRDRHRRRARLLDRRRAGPPAGRLSTQLTDHRRPAEARVLQQAREVRDPDRRAIVVAVDEDGQTGHADLWRPELDAVPGRRSDRSRHHRVGIAEPAPGLATTPFADAWL